jgi:murein DD-endopeptidase MepM/ murein hydrolase activator NlpD
MKNLTMSKNVFLFLAFTLISLLTFAQKKDDAEIQRLTKDFNALKGKLVCPLVASKIDFKTLYLDENRQPTRGVDLISDSSKVKSPLEGYVTAIFPDEEKYNSIIVCHGNYFLVYSHVYNVSVKQGQTLKTGDLIGAAALDKKNKPRLHLEIWFNTDKLWPPDWLSCGNK